MTEGTTAARLLTTTELAERLGVTPATVRRWASSGRVPAYRVHNRLRFDVAEVEQRLIRRVGA